MSKILLKLDGKVIREYTLKEKSTSIGRKPDNDIVINNPAVSGHHCVIEKQGDVYTLEDLGSTNGTSVNDKVIRKIGLHQNDVIGIAKHQLVFLEDASHVAVAAHTGTDLAKEVPAAVQAPQEPIGDSVAEKPKIGVIKILKGGPVNQEFEIRGNSMYIGKSDRAQIPIEGSGIFGSAPEVAASVHRKPEGFVLVAVEDGYPSVAGQKVRGKVSLKDGDIIECGSTTLQFSLKHQA